MSIASKIASDPRYRQLVSQRDTLAWSLSAIVFVMYFGFVLLVAFAGDVVTQPIAEGSVVPVGMLLGVGVIAVSCLLTAIYVWRANEVFDPLTREIIKDASA